MMKRLLLVAALLLPLCAHATYRGDIYLGDTIDHVWSSYDDESSAAEERTVAGTAACYPTGSATQITAGVTDTGTTEFDAFVGLNRLTIVATAANGYAAGSDYDCVVTGVTMNGDATVVTVFSFSIENRALTKGLIKARGLAGAGSASATVELGAAAVSADDQFNTMTFWDVTTGEKYCVTDTINSSDQIIVYPNPRTAIGTSDVWRILVESPCSPVDFEAAVANALDDKNLGAFTANAMANLEVYYNNDGNSSVDYLAARAASISLIAGRIGNPDVGGGETITGMLSTIDLPDQTMNITGNITGDLSGSVGSVTGAVGSVTGNVGGVAGTIGTLDALDTAQDAQHATTQTAVADVPTVQEIWDHVIDGTLDAEEVLCYLAAILVNESDFDDVAGNQAEFMNAAGTAPKVTVTYGGTNGQDRTGVTLAACGS